MFILSDKYRETMNKLDIKVSDLNVIQLKRFIGCISKFVNLLDLTLEFNSITEPIDDSLSLIGQKYNKLMKLNLKILKSVRISDQFFNVFLHFKTLKKLTIMFDRKRHNTVLSGSVECFKHCKQLTDIDINYSELREDFFVNIATFVPKLQSLQITTNNKFSDSFIHLFDSIKDSIQSVKLNEANVGYCQHYFNQ